MALWVAYFRFRPGTNVLQGLAAFERRKSFEHPRQATLLGEYWVNAPEDQPQVVLAWEAEDEGPGITTRRRGATSSRSPSRRQRDP